MMLTCFGRTLPSSGMSHCDVNLGNKMYNILKELFLISNYWISNAECIDGPFQCEPFKMAVSKTT
jgi:hypothetical protein